VLLIDRFVVMEASAYDSIRDMAAIL